MCEESKGRYLMGREGQERREEGSPDIASRSYDCDLLEVV